MESDSTAHIVGQRRVSEQCIRCFVFPRFDEPSPEEGAVLLVSPMWDMLQLKTAIVEVLSSGKVELGVEDVKNVFLKSPCVVDVTRVAHLRDGDVLVASIGSGFDATRGAFEMERDYWTGQQAYWQTIAIVCGLILTIAFVPLFGPPAAVVAGGESLRVAYFVFSAILMIASTMSILVVSVFLISGHGATQRWFRWWFLSFPMWYFSTGLIGLVGACMASMLGIFLIIVYITAYEVFVGALVTTAIFVVLAVYLFLQAWLIAIFVAVGVDGPWSKQGSHFDCWSFSRRILQLARNRLIKRAAQSELLDVE